MIITTSSESPDSAKQVFLPIYLFYGAIAAAILIVLYLISLRNYILFHGIVELAGIAVAFSIFIIIWNTRRVIPDAFFLIVGISFLFIGGIDLAHTLVYKGMGVLPGNSSDLPTQLWIAARYFQSITFLIATLFIGKSITKDRNYDAGIIIAACTAACALLFLSIFVWQNFPQCFIEGSGLTPFKIASEYIISLILIATIAIVHRKREHFDPTVWKFLITAQMLLILGELAFTSYVSVYGFMNLLGHLFRLSSVYLFYRAFVVISLTRPYDIILRDLKKEEESLRESEKKYRTLFENMLEGFAYCRMVYNDKGVPADWEYLAVNSAFEQITGIKDIIGKRVLEAIPNIRELNPELFDAYGRVASTGRSETFDIDFKPLNMWLRVSVFSPEKGYFVAVFEDITQRRQTEETLRETNEYLRNLIEYANAPIIVWDKAFRITRFNHAFEHLTGRTEQETLGQHLDVLFPDESRDVSLQKIRETLVGKRWEVVEIPILHVSGGIRTVLWNSANIVDPNGAIISTIAQGQDITERKRAEEALRQANNKLNILSSITRHDILNQITILRGYLELSKKDFKGTKHETFIDREEQAAIAIQRQIEFTRYYQDIGVNAPKWQDAEAVIREALAQLNPPGVDVQVAVCGIEIFADPQIVKVFFNLLENSLRHGERVTAMSFSSCELDTGLVITYRDNGVGITADDKQKLFQKGFGKHTGLGLFLSREILSITGITIKENGEPGNGVRFEITVPNGAWRATGSGGERSSA